MSQKNNFVNRIVELCKVKDWSQFERAAKEGVSFAQIRHSETNISQPLVIVLKKIADALEITVYFLVHGNIDYKAKAYFHVTKVIGYFKKVDTLFTEDRFSLLRIIFGFLIDVINKQYYSL
jgi:transcriptional regulator with XRE-family HTH domain